MKNCPTFFFMRNGLPAPLLACLLWLGGLAYAHAQTVLSGKVTDKTGEALPFAGVVIKGTTKGTTTNAEGVYNLLIPTGAQEIVFHYIGYKTLTRTVQASSPTITLDVVLETDATELKEITVGSEDPAYAIIRAAQAKRRYYLEEEFQHYKCKAYNKIFQEADHAGGVMRLFGTVANIERGVYYLSETQSEITFRQPNQYQEKVLASKVSQDTTGFSHNHAIWLNFYENKSFNSNGLDIISPIAQNAMDYYRYSLESSTREGDLLIHKIELLPKNNAVALRGFIYIIDESARIHSIDAYIPKGTIGGVDSMGIRQLYTPVTANPKGIWLPLSLTFSFRFKIGNARGFYHTITSDYELNAPLGKDFSEEKTQEFAPDANRKTEQEWQELRPMPLTKAESSDYQLKKDIQRLQVRKEVRDSIMRQYIKMRPRDIFLTGMRFDNPFAKSSLQITPLLSWVHYNTVEGLVLAPRFTSIKGYQGGRKLSLSSQFRYGFSNARLQTKLHLDYLYNPHRLAHVSVEGGKYIRQFNTIEPIFEPINTFYTLFVKENYLKIFEQRFVNVKHEIELFNGFLWEVRGEWSKRTALENTADYSLIRASDKYFTSNSPTHAESLARPYLFEDNQTARIETQITFVPKQRYALHPEEKIILGSRLPAFMARYSKGMIDSDFDLLQVGMHDTWNWGKFGGGVFSAAVGKFLNRNKIYFADFHHFNGNQTIALQTHFFPFQLLDYYAFSQADQYAEVHWRHDLRGWLTNKIPFLKRNQTSLAFGANYLYTPQLGNYYEAGIGIKRIFKSLHIYWWNSFDERGHLMQGIRLSGG